MLVAPETDLRRPTTGLGGALSLFCESPLRMTPESGLAILKLLKADISQTAARICRARAAGGEVLAGTAGQSGAAASTDVPRMDVVERYARASVAARQNVQSVHQNALLRFPYISVSQSMFALQAGRHW